MQTFWFILAFACLTAPVARAQTISGTVADARTGLPIFSANVVLVGGGAGTSTDRSGGFVLQLPAGQSHTLRISHVGYIAEERTVDMTEQPSLRIQLAPTPMAGPEVEVTAARARERHSPVTFSNLTAQNLREWRDVQDVPVLLSDLPSSTFYSEGGSGVGYNYLRIRGFDQRRLAIMINGVPQNDPEDHNVYWIDFTDLLESASGVHVQRGAGSAFYGPPAIGGSVNIETGDFANRKGVTVSGGWGSFNTMRSSLAVGSGLVDNRYVIFGRLSTTATDGYRNHSFVNATSLYLTATRYDSNFTTRLTLYGGPLEDGLAYNGIPKFAVKDRIERRKNYNYWEQDSAGKAYTYTQLRRPQEREEFTQPHAEILQEWRVNEVVTLSSTLFYVRGYGFFDYDGTGYTDADYFRMTPAYGFPVAVDPKNPIIRAYVDNRQGGWLPRISVSHAGGVFAAGIETRFHRSLHWGKVQWAEALPDGLDPDRRYYEYRGGKDILSAYAQETFAPLEGTTIAASAQYVFNRYHLYDETFVGTDFTVDYRFFNPRIGVNVNLDEHWNVYASASHTRREPRLNNLYDAGESSGGALPQFARKPDGSFDFDSPLVRSESLFNLEAGGGYFSDRVKLLANVFWMDFTDEIVKNGQLDRFGNPVTGNADRSVHLGIEASATVYLPFGLELEANGMRSRDRLTRFSVAEAVPDSDPERYELRSLDGNRIAGFPELLFNARLMWRGDGVMAGVAVKHVGDQYTDNMQSERNKVEAYTVVNAVAGYTTPPALGLRAIAFRLTVNNVFDALFAQSGEAEQFFVGAERSYFFDISVDL